MLARLGSYRYVVLLLCIVVLSTLLLTAINLRTRQPSSAASPEPSPIASAQANAQTSPSPAPQAPSSTSAAASAQTQHPLDPLTAQEHEATLEILRAANKIDATTRFPLITLQEPDKSRVLAWQPGAPTQRTAFAIVKQGAQTFEAVVDLTGRRLESWRKMQGVQPSMLLEEITGVQAIVLEDPAFRKALADRGIRDTDDLSCAPLSVGYYNIPEEEGRRLLRVPCYLIEGSTTNLFSRPIEGLYGLVDLNSRKLLKILDTGVRPLPQEKYEFSEEAIGKLRDPLKPVQIAQPAGSNIKISGQTIAWDTWSFHQRLDKRTGLVISQVTFKEGDTPRSILYQGSLAEVFVPYMDPDLGWYWRTYMDAGEYGFGVNATPLTAGIDCPETATFLSAVIAGDDGKPATLERVICVFERPTGDPAWRHFETINGVYEGRPSVELVTRMIATVGNYDYVLDWIFTQDGKIRVRVGATGIDITKGVASTSMHDATAQQDTAYGTLVAPNLVAVNHDHYFSFRLDLDVDGPENSFAKMEFKQVPLENHPRTSIWQTTSTTLKTESEARLNVDPTQSVSWMVMNERRQHALDHHPSYALKPMNSATTNLLSAEDYPARRAAFSMYNLWVTPYAADEHYPAGVYVNQSKGGDGLPQWTRANRSIANQDIVLWYTAGLHHKPHLEDWPVLPLSWVEFQLTPHNFFARNPAIDLRQP